MLLNELAQWGALICVGILALGLTRQLGVFLVPAHEQAALEVGPDVGKRFPAGFLSASQRAELVAEMERRGVELATFLVVSERCQTCRALLDELAAGARQRLPIVALLRESSAEHRQLLEAVASLVIVDAAQLDALNLTIEPLALVVDREFKVQAKQLVFSVDQLNGMTPPLQGASSEHAVPQSTPPELAVMTVEGRTQ